MAEVAARIRRARLTVTTGVERAVVGAVRGVADVQRSLRCERRAIAAAARRRHAVEQIDAALDRGDKIRGEPDAHKITGQCRRQSRLEHIDGLVHFVLRLADRQPADGDAGPGPQFHYSIQGLGAKRGQSAALDDRPQRLVTRRHVGTLHERALVLTCQRAVVYSVYELRMSLLTTR